MKKITTALLCLAFASNICADEDDYKTGFKCVTNPQKEYVQTSYIGLVVIDDVSYTGIYKESISAADESIPARTLILDDGVNSSIYIWRKSIFLGPLKRRVEYPPQNIAQTFNNPPAEFGDCSPWKIDPNKFIKPQKKK